MALKTEFWPKIKQYWSFRDG